MVTRAVKLEPDTAGSAKATRPRSRGDRRSAQPVTPPSGTSLVLYTSTTGRAEKGVQSPSGLRNHSGISAVAHT